MKIKKTILITGCGSGFGRDSAIALAKRGHRVIATTETEKESEDLAELAKANTWSMETFKLDVVNPDDRDKILNYDLDVLVNNAGVGESGSLAEIPLEKIRHDFEVNVFSSFALAQLALQKMMKNNRGTVLFVSSLAGRISMPFLGSYSMTKFALIGGVTAMRQEIYKITKSVHASLIEPGAYHTGFNQKNIAKMFVWMDEKSYFYKVIEKLKIDSEKYFERLEVKSTDSLVRQIIRASEARKPKLRYSAPWWQNWGVMILRVFGK